MLFQIKLCLFASSLKINVMAKQYLAVSLESGISIINNTDELGTLIDNDISYDVLGVVCDSRSFGDNCVSCPFKDCVCPSINVTDMDGSKWHVISDEKFNSMTGHEYTIFRRFLDESHVSHSLSNEDFQIHTSLPSFAGETIDDLPF